MKQILAFGTLMVICAMLGAFLRSMPPDQVIRAVSQENPAILFEDCHKWSPMDAHPNCKPELCPTVEDETQMVCR